ncbi:holo-ACP synthase [Flavobacterium sp. N1736]|uniref:holo-ACP synthase n=1 Tax=Flavobacterium sp. N1736 TaxID=2986823 RepID=UPI0022248544|nr:holo-ACP synthase [Flavobacterium sp. N1736]
MIISIGCDIVEHSLIKKLKWNSNAQLQKRCFSQKEIDLYNTHKKSNFIPGRFAVKEAVLKCLGIGMEDGLSLKDIQTLQSKNGQPFIELFGEVKKRSDNLGITSWHVSISHTKKNSIAYVIAEKIK